MPTQPQVVIDKAVLGGISDSVYMGKPNSLASIVGFNLHKVPGLMLVNQKFSHISPANGVTKIDDLVKILHCSDGKARLFGKNTGKIWEIDSNGNFTQPAVIPVISDPFLPTIAVNDNSIGNGDWVSPTNVLVEDGIASTFETDIIAGTGQLKTVTVNAGGSGYTVGDILTLVGGTGSVTVATLGGGNAVATVTINPGSTGFGPGTGILCSGGTGSGATFNTTVYNNDEIITVNVSHYLKTTGFGINIPSDAVVTGVIVEIKEYKTQDNNSDLWQVLGGSVKLVKGGTITGSDLGTAPIGNDPNVYNNLGGTTNLWGLVLTPADVNDPTFGVAISRSGEGAIANIDVVRIRICYYLANGHGSPVFDAEEYMGPGGEPYVYYSIPNFVGRYRVGDPITQRVDNYGMFLNGDKFAHPMKQQNLVLYIGDGNVVAQIDASGETNVPYSPTTFSQIALRINFDERVTTMGNQRTNLLVGSKNVKGKNLCFVYNWDTFDKSFNQSDPITENGVNAFMPDKQRIIISAGENGNFYQYVNSFYGMYLEPLEQIPPAFPTLFDPSNTAILYHTAVDTHQHIPIFGFSRVIGNPALQGLYTLGCRDTTYPVILTLEYPVGTQNLQNLTIWSIEVVGNDIYISYLDETDPQNPVYWVDKLDWNLKQPAAYFETMIMKFTKTLMDLYRDFVVGFDQLPAGCSIDFYYNKNKTSYVKLNSSDYPNEFTADTDRKFYKGTQQIQARTIQFKVVVNAIGNTAADIEDLTTILGA